MWPISGYGMAGKLSMGVLDVAFVSLFTGKKMAMRC